MRDPTESAIAAQARSAGMISLRQSSIMKAGRGETTYEEAIRVTHSDSGGRHVCPSCDRSVEPDMIACPYCAFALDQGHCAKCGHNLEPDWKVCPYCKTPAPPIIHPSAGGLLEQ
jgi:type IV pilus assembly protein PilB